MVSDEFPEDSLFSEDKEIAEPSSSVMRLVFKTWLFLVSRFCFKGVGAFLVIGWGFGFDFGLGFGLGFGLDFGGFLVCLKLLIGIAAIGDWVVGVSDCGGESDDRPLRRTASLVIGIGVVVVMNSRKGGK